MVEELEEELKIGEIKLTPGEAFCYTAWGARYRFKDGSWRVPEMSFRRKEDAEDWVNRHHLRHKDVGMEAEVIQVKRCLLLGERGVVTSWTEELA
ncbi:hypothetical protein ES704_02063 [subsurface metagenome]